MHKAHLTPSVTHCQPDIFHSHRFLASIGHNRRQSPSYKHPVEQCWCGIFAFESTSSFTQQPSVSKITSFHFHSAPGKFKPLEQMSQSYLLLSHYCYSLSELHCKQYDRKSKSSWDDVSSVCTVPGVQAAIGSDICYLFKHLVWGSLLRTKTGVGGKQRSRATVWFTPTKTFTNLAPTFVFEKSPCHVFVLDLKHLPPKRAFFIPMFTGKTAVVHCCEMSRRNGPGWQGKSSPPSVNQAPLSLPL